MTVVKLTKNEPELNDLLLEGQRLKEINRLGEQLAKSRTELRLLSIELQQIEKDINKFLDEYFSSVGEFFNKKNKDLSSTPANINQTIDKNEFNENDSLNEIIKKLYKKLSKMCHPDIQGNDSISKFFTTISDAYNEKNLQELLRVEEYLSGEGQDSQQSPREKLEKLSQVYDEVLNKIRDLKDKKISILQSPEYELKRQVLWAKMCGKDLISKIKSDLYKQLQTAAIEL